MSNLDSQYRTSVSRTLKKYGIVPKYFEPAAASSDTADLILEYNNRRAGCELKFVPSNETLKIKYYVNSARPWQFDYVSAVDDEKFFIKKIIQSSHVFRRIRRVWRKAPMNRNKDGDWYRSVAKFNAQQRHQYDVENFPEVSGVIDGETIELFYTRLDIYYMNIGTTGLYALGPADPLKLNIPRFADMGSISWTAKINSRSSLNYSFIIDAKMNVGPSSVNIAPVDGKSAIVIETGISQSLLPETASETEE